MPPERKVLLHVYDCTTTASGASSPAIARLNAVTRELWLGGIFHGAVELEHTGREWSFGYCPEGTGVYDCPAKVNPLYRFRESIVLGSTCLSLSQVGPRLAGGGISLPQPQAHMHLSMLCCRCH